eukprot:scaffold13024_cov71-Skeletonema_dohrnii-CCMP3373.AAC.1
MIQSERVQRLNFCHGAKDYIVVVDLVICSADSCYQVGELHNMCSGVNGALFEMGILIYQRKRHQLFDSTTSHITSSSSKNDNGRYSSPSRPIRTMSGVLESP